MFTGIFARAWCWTIIWNRWIQAAFCFSIIHLYPSIYHLIFEGGPFLSFLTKIFCALVISSSTFWTSDTTESISVRETVCKNNSRVILPGQCDESFLASRHRWSIVHADADAWFPRHVVLIEKSVENIKNVSAFCCFSESSAKKKKSITIKPAEC
jgi:hypothetical protein